MEKSIPEDVLEAAKEAAAEIEDSAFYHDGPSGAGFRMGEAEKIVASYLLAERERCAKMAEDTLVAADAPWDYASPSDCLAHAATTARVAIAAAIRSAPPA